MTISGRKLAKLRGERLLTQEDLAQRLDVTKGNISRIEGQDKTGVQVKNFRKLAEVFEVSPEELRSLVGIDPPILHGVAFALDPADYFHLEAHAKKAGQSVDETAKQLVLAGLPDDDDSPVVEVPPIMPPPPAPQAGEGSAPVPKRQKRPARRRARAARRADSGRAK